MLHPADVDGRSLVILRRRHWWFGSQFCVMASGMLEHDGETVSLVSDQVSRVVPDDELAAIKLVNSNNQIAECRGFDLFLIQESRTEANRETDRGAV